MRGTATLLLVLGFGAATGGFGACATAGGAVAAAVDGFESTGGGGAPEDAGIGVVDISAGFV